jgi:hypothetical protein
VISSDKWCHLKAGGAGGNRGRTWPDSLNTQTKTKSKKLQTFSSLDPPTKKQPENPAVREGRVWEVAYLLRVG